MRERVGLWTLVLVMGVSTLVLYVDNKRTRDCIAEYMVKDQQNTAVRANLSEGERAAFLRTMQVIFDPKSTSTQRREVGEGYITLVEENDVKRSQSPPLPVPTECD